MKLTLITALILLSTFSVRAYQDGTVYDPGSQPAPIDPNAQLACGGKAEGEICIWAETGSTVLGEGICVRDLPTQALFCN